MPRFQWTSANDDYVIRAPAFWRDLYLGLLWGFALVWASMDALHRSMVLLIGFSLPLFRAIFLVFAFKSVTWALVVAVWASALIISFRFVNRKYQDCEVPDGFTGLELLLSFSVIGIGVLILWELHVFLGLSG